MVSNFRRRKTLTRVPRERLLFCVARYAVFGRRIDFPRLPETVRPRRVRGGASVRRSERRKGAFFAPERRISPVAGTTARRKVVPPDGGTLHRQFSLRKQRPVLRRAPANPKKPAAKALSLLRKFETISSLSKGKRRNGFKKSLISMFVSAYPAPCSPPACGCGRGCACRTRICGKSCRRASRGRCKPTRPDCRARRCPDRQRP